DPKPALEEKADTEVNSAAASVQAEDYLAHSGSAAEVEKPVDYTALLTPANDLAPASVETSGEAAPAQPSVVKTQLGVKPQRKQTAEQSPVPPAQSSLSGGGS